MKIATLNLNGIRSALEKGLTDELTRLNADIVCFQETKIDASLLEQFRYMFKEYYSYFHSAQKKGYSGVCVLSKREPTYFVTGCDDELFNSEGRIIRCDYDDFTLVNVYLPSGSMGAERQVVKERFMDYFFDYLARLKLERPNLVVVGDMNICHTEIDIHNPSKHTKVSGFLPNERVWFSKLLGSGFVDSFRLKNPETIQYTWWSYRSGARPKNLGWRIDYALVSEPLKDRIVSTQIMQETVLSDHCPVVLEIS